MKRVIVVGGGPAGAFAAERLASAGVRTILIDEKLAWEKPCGGGLTYKAYREYPFLVDNSTPKRLITEMRLISPRAAAATLELEHPLLIYSRLELNDLLLRRAERAGASLEKTRVVELARRGEGWTVRTKNGSWEADFCVIATGARNPLRQTGTEWGAGDVMCALGYYVPGGQEHIDIQFLPDFEGYIWIFPRCGHLSVGICGKSVPAHVMRKQLEARLDERGIPWRGSPFYSHLIPSLEQPAWKRNRVAGPGWLAVGDAAGLVDPITGEGLYYAIRSADLAAQVLLNHHQPAEKAGQEYCARLWQDFAADLEYAAHLSARFYRGTFLGRHVVERSVEFTCHSSTFRTLVDGLIAGTLPYRALKPKVYQSVPRLFAESGLGRLRALFGRKSTISTAGSRTAPAAGNPACDYPE